MTGKDHCFDNAAAESFFGTLKLEVEQGTTFKTRQAAENAIFEYLEGFYNRNRRHSALNYQSPIAFEEAA